MEWGVAQDRYGRGVAHDTDVKWGWVWKMWEVWHRIRTTAMGGNVTQDKDNTYGRKCGAE